MKNNIKRILVQILLIINTFLLIISFSISFTILFRPFYYINIKYLKIEEESGYTYNDIKEAYDDILNYSTLNKPFSTGKLKHSAEGESHFKDCKKLFLIDFIVLGISTIIFILKKKMFNNIKLFNYSIEFYSSCLVIFLFTSILFVTLTVGFDRCFEIFHNIFFLGKENWLFNPETDEIINILPQQYFMNCAILIFIISGIISIAIILKEIIEKRFKIGTVLFSNFHRHRRS